jgi:hypothetical protein
MRFDTLGQPAPGQFVEMLTRIGASAEEARSLAIDLSAIGPFIGKQTYHHTGQHEPTA